MATTPNLGRSQPVGLSEEQLRELRVVFDYIDTDHSNTIELGELKTAIKRIDSLITNEDLEFFFNLLDKDHDQKVQFDEFVTAMTEYLPNREPVIAKPTTPQQESTPFDIADIPMVQGLKDHSNPMCTNPIQFAFKNFIGNDERIMESAVVGSTDNSADETSGSNPTTQAASQTGRLFVRAGPRTTIRWNTDEVNPCIVTCGGLCPGLNSVIRELTRCLIQTYKVKQVWGVKYGYEGFYRFPMVPMTIESVSRIHHLGGTVLGSSRGGFDLDKIVESIEKNKINQLYIIGGDGTHRGARKIAEELIRRNLIVSVACMPKTIDNDFQLIDRSFGFLTAVEEAQRAIQSAKTEAEGAENGIGLVKLMGRQSGFIATIASLGSMDVDYCLIPEVPFHMPTLLRHVRSRLSKQGHVVLVAAEGENFQVEDSS
eukprot:TRINITY_DN4620_c0_g2_i1.p1 TRINITY_DN4620_c0_g2~~TRINITY_DN4620_c0_g2_i1.p1  ORF type:complete len:435 (-),score=98.24 TRINITY_DN4620_c0_g2_i1:127-1410(-)